MLLPAMSGAHSHLRLREFLICFLFLAFVPYCTSVPLCDTSGAVLHVMEGSACSLETGTYSFDAVQVDGELQIFDQVGLIAAQYVIISANGVVNGLGQGGTTLPENCGTPIAGQGGAHGGDAGDLTSCGALSHNHKHSYSSDRLARLAWGATRSRAEPFHWLAFCRVLDVTGARWGR